MSKPILGYWKIRGLGSGIRYQLAYQGVEYDQAQYEQGDAPDFSNDSWLTVKPTLGFAFPNLPYFINGDLKLSETMAIHKYIADKWNPELLGKDAETRAEVNMVAMIFIEWKFKTAVPCYMTGNLDEVLASNPVYLAKMREHRGNKKFWASEDVSFLDFQVFELFQALNALTKGAFLSENADLAQYCETMKNLPKLKEYLETCEDKDMLFNNKSAKLNAKQENY